MLTGRRLWGGGTLDQASWGMDQQAGMRADRRQAGRWGAWEVRHPRCEAGAEGTPRARTTGMQHAGLAAAHAGCRQVSRQRTHTGEAASPVLGCSLSCATPGLPPEGGLAPLPPAPAAAVSGLVYPAAADAGAGPLPLPAAPAAPGGVASLLWLMPSASASAAAAAAAAAALAAACLAREGGCCCRCLSLCSPRRCRSPVLPRPESTRGSPPPAAARAAAPAGLLPDPPRLRPRECMHGQGAQGSGIIEYPGGAS